MGRAVNYQPLHRQSSGAQDRIPIEPKFFSKDNCAFLVFLPAFVLMGLLLYLDITFEPSYRLAIAGLLPAGTKFYSGQRLSLFQNGSVTCHANRGKDIYGTDYRVSVGFQDDSVECFLDSAQGVTAFTGNISIPYDTVLESDAECSADTIFVNTLGLLCYGANSSAVDVKVDADFLVCGRTPSSGPCQDLSLAGFITTNTSLFYDANNSKPEKTSSSFDIAE
jgi:hypothetical protein